MLPKISFSLRKLVTTLTRSSKHTMFILFCKKQRASTFDDVSPISTSFIAVSTGGNVFYSQDLHIYKCLLGNFLHYAIVTFCRGSAQWWIQMGAVPAPPPSLRSRPRPLHCGLCAGPVLGPRCTRPLLIAVLVFPRSRPFTCYKYTYILYKTHLLRIPGQLQLT